MYFKFYIEGDMMYVCVYEFLKFYSMNIECCLMIVCHKYRMLNAIGMTSGIYIIGDIS